MSAEKLLDNDYTSMLGVVTRGDYYGLYHAALIDTVDAPEIDEPIQLITWLADRFEQELTGKDDF